MAKMWVELKEKNVRVSQIKWSLKLCTDQLSHQTFVTRLDQTVIFQFRAGHQQNWKPHLVPPKYTSAEEQTAEHSTAELQAPPKMGKKS